MSCLCVDDLKPASFRGVSFYVEKDDGHYGRRIKPHEYPMRDKPYNEDLGEKAQKFNVVAYVFGDDWVSKKDAVVAACRKRGPALLSLPAEDPKMVRCHTLEVSRSKDKCGYFELKMEFLAEGDSSGTGLSVGGLGISTPIGSFEVQIGEVFADAIGPLTEVFDIVYEIDDALGWVVDNQIARVTEFANDAISAIESNAVTDGDTGTSTLQSAINIYQNADEYTQPDVLSSQLLVGQEIPSATISTLTNGLGTFVFSSGGVTVTQGASAVVPMIAAVIDGIGDSMDADSAIEALTPLVSFSVKETRVSSLTRAAQELYGAVANTPLANSDVTDAKNSEIFNGVVRTFALIKLAQALSVKTFRTRTDAVQARANLVERFNMQIAMFDEDDVVNRLLEARDLAVQAITQRMASVVSVIKVQAPQTRPSLYWANRLYQDLDRAEELVDRNDVGFPAYMPTVFEALAS